MNRTSHLEYAKTILTKVAFDKSLFIKEYHKALSQLNAVEQDILRNWTRLYVPAEDVQDRMNIP